MLGYLNYVLVPERGPGIQSCTGTCNTAQLPIGKTGKCRSKPLLHELEITPILSCALEGENLCDGNHIQYAINENTFDLQNVYAEYCKPKPKKCHCKTMLHYLLSQNPNIVRIEGTFSAKPAIAGCRCYLGVAAKNGFQYVKLESSKEGCSAEQDFITTSYKTICKDYQKLKCFDADDLIGAFGVNGVITRESTDSDSDWGRD